MPHPNSKRAKAAKAKRKQARSRASGDPVVQTRRVDRGRRQGRAQVARRRRALRRKVRFYAAISGGALVLALAGWFMLKPGPELEGVERLANRGRDHVTGATYADSAPTSGAHAAQSPRCGVFPTPLPLDLAVHGLEHGVVVLWYDPADPVIGVELASLMTRWNSHVIVSPGIDLDAPVVATAWNRRMRFTEASAEVAEFIDTYRNRGPEDVACLIT